MQSSTSSSEQQTAGCPPREAFPLQIEFPTTEREMEEEEDVEETEMQVEVASAAQASAEDEASAGTASTQEESCSSASDSSHGSDRNDTGETENPNFQQSEGVEEEQQSQQQTERFERGDHVYQWCSLLGIPGVFQHHGIVLHAEDVVTLDDEIEDDNGEQLLTIADFSNLLFVNKDDRSQQGDWEDELVEFDSYDDQDDRSQATHETRTFHSDVPQPAARPAGSGGSLFASSGASPSTSNSSSVRVPFKDGCLRVYTTVSTKDCKWHKVKYNDHWFHTHIWKRSGTCTPVQCDDPETVMKRVNFLLSHSQIHPSSEVHTNDKNNTEYHAVLPKYHSIFANCECVAVWCKTGTWSTLQAASFLSHSAVAQAKGTATIAGIAAAQTVTVPASGLWGWLGYSTTVPLMAANPLVLPAICAYGAVAVGGPAVCLAVAKSKWKATTKRLNDALDAQSLEVALVM